MLCSWARQFTIHHASVPTPTSFINGYAQDEKTIIRKLKHGGNMLLHCENTGTKIMRLSVSGYIIVFHVSVAAFTMEPEHFFTCFQQISVSGITVS